MILVNLKKAFDTISWEYIYKILKSFNLSEKTMLIIKSLQKNSKSKILQNGHPSEIIKLGRGCGHLVLAVELLKESIRKHDEIKGITICGKEQRISQFADDTTLFTVDFRLTARCG